MHACGRVCAWAHVYVGVCMHVFVKYIAINTDCFTLLCLNSVYISTFNYYVRLQFQEGVGGQGLFVLYLYKFVRA